MKRQLLEIIKKLWEAMFGKCWECGGNGSITSSYPFVRTCTGCYGSGRAGIGQIIMAIILMGIPLLVIIALIMIIIDPVLRSKAFEFIYQLFPQ